MTEDNVYEFSFNLAEQQEMTGDEMILLGSIFTIMAKNNHIPPDRHNIILEHILAVNRFIEEQKGWVE